MSVVIKEVTSKKELKKFVKFNIELYKGNPYHVPGLIEEEMVTLDKKKNPAFEVCDAIYFLAYKDGKVVGRIAGMINRRSNETWNQKYARFGFVDFIDDAEVVDALFGAVEKWAVGQGMEALQGPMGFTDMDHEGMLIEGFDQIGTMATIYNYPYYPKQMERMGYTKDQDWHEFKIYIPDGVPEKHLRIGEIVKKKYGLDTAVITGSIDGKTTIKGFKVTLNNVLTCFSPVSKGRNVLMPGSKAEIDILIATDCISEGQNLQDCDYLINYDIHWNPVRIIQRFGRIDRIGSRNNYIQLVNFWPDLTLDDYINLRSRVETRMKITVMTSTGDDDLINEEEKGDLEYRKQQLKRLQEEVVDIEDMSEGISIMDLGLNEFRLDLLEYVKTHGNMDNKPRGLHAVVPAAEELPKGVIFVLKNINKSVNIDNQNRIHPFYMVYIGMDGEIIGDYLNPKKLLDDVRLLCRGKNEPVHDLCRQFNAETDDGRNMAELSELLSEAIRSIIDTKEESDIDSLFSAGGTSALMSAVSGLDDFELICFLAVK